MTKDGLNNRAQALNKQITAFLLDSVRYTEGDRPDLALEALGLAESALKDAKYVAQCLISGDTKYIVEFRPKGHVNAKWEPTKHEPAVYDIAMGKLHFTRSMYYKTHEYRLTPVQASV